MPEEDKTIFQMDEGSFKGDGSTQTPVMSLFKMLIMAEREKNVTEHRMSFLTVSRQADNVVEAGTDAFSVAIRQKMKYKCVKDPRSSEDKVTCKNFFAKCFLKVELSEQLLTVFRFRWEHVGGNWKIQRPYVLTKIGIALQKGKPHKD